MHDSRHCQLSFALVAALCLPACGDDPAGQPDAPDGGISPGDQNSVAIVASEGGSLTLPGGGIKVTVPANGLDRDATLTITEVAEETPALGAPLAANGDAYRIAFDNGATLTQPMTLEMTADAAPAHPQLGEIAQLAGDAWERIPANFFRASDRMVVGLTTAQAAFRVVNRSLRAVSGPSVERGRDAFLYETFGNEDFFGGVLGLHSLLNVLTPATAVAVGVQVDLAKVPQGIVDVLTGPDNAAKDAALQNPAVTRALILADAVVGVKGIKDPNSDLLTSAGITCALCHVTVTPTEFQLTGGPTDLPIGPLRLDGVPNPKIDAGKILSLTPFAQAAGQPTINLLQSWGPARFDVRALPDNTLDDTANNPTTFPPLWNFVDLEAQGYRYDWDGLFQSREGEDNSLASQAEAVYDLVMHANGAFGTATGSVAPELSIDPPPALLVALAAAETAAPGNDIDADTLLDVQDFQRSILSPAPGSFDEASAEKGFQLFHGKARCSGCHSSPEFTGPGDFADITRAAPTGALSGGTKVPGLRGIASTAPYFSDGSAVGLLDVINVYSGRVVPALTDAEKAALVEYLKSL